MLQNQVVHLEECRKYFEMCIWGEVGCGKEKWFSVIHFHNEILFLSLY